MKCPPFPSVYALSSLALALSLAAIAPAQAPRQLITEGVDNAQRLTLHGNTRPEAIAANDLGAADAGTRLDALQLILRRSPESEAAFTQYVAESHDPGSPNYHKWLTNAQIGALFGPSAEDIATVKNWLTSEGFSVNSVSPDGLVIEFSGTAGQVSEAFHAPLHNLRVYGKAHLANFNDPDIPAALAPAVAGVAKLNDFMPHALNIPRPRSQANSRKGVATGGFTAYLGAADLATIYNFNPLFKAGITGKGQTIVLIEDTDQYSVGDWLAFRKVLGLSAAFPHGSLTQVNPQGSNRCKDPGIGMVGGTGDNAGDDVEAAIDIEWASAAAPNAAIVNAACADTQTQFGGFLALANLLQQRNPPPVVSISYGEAEALDGAAENFYIYELYQIAAAEGVSVFVSSGDEDAASSAGGAVSTYGIGVSGFTSTPYNISVGGTDFGYLPLGTPGTYFNTANGPNFQSAVSYIPEIPWNNSCAGSLLVSAIGAPFTTYGPNSVCNNYLDFVTQTEADEGALLNAVGGSGGPSACAVGNPQLSGVVSGSCEGWAKPYWQKLVGVPRDGVRDIPDVSLFASNGFWGVYYAVCISDPTGSSGFTPCTGDPSTWAGFGGTSISSPIWAGIQALVNQKTGQRWGNSNTVLYTLAAAEYGESGNASCNSSLGNAIGAHCLFNDVTQGDNVGACQDLVSGSKKHPVSTPIDCYIDGGIYGILSTSDWAPKPAYNAGVGWDFTSGIGTANAANIVNANWPIPR
jgi:subtilase family serine protease